jgi:CRP-like cAMP-binding protein
MMPTLPMSDAHRALVTVVTALAGTDDAPEPAEVSAFLALFRPRMVARGAHLVQAGDLAPSLDFVVEGFLRLYYLRPDGREFTKGFVRAGSFHTVLESVLEDRPTRYAVQAATPARLLVADYREVATYFDRHVFWQRLARRVLERLALLKLRREATLLMDSAATRYAAFLHELGELEPQLTDGVIASYLGVTPETLSRIKRDRVIAVRS